MASIAQPLDAEVLAEGSWWPGAVLGWRHDEAGVCQAEVRVAVAGVERVRWVDLTAVRLPQSRDVAASPVAPTREPAAETVVISRADLGGLVAPGVPARPSARRRRHASDLTAELPVVRCAEPGPAAGRHRAPAAVGRHRAAEPAERAARPAVTADPLTRPIRLGDVPAWSWAAPAAGAR